MISLSLKSNQFLSYVSELIILVNFPRHMVDSKKYRLSFICIKDS